MDYREDEMMPQPDPAKKPDAVEDELTSIRRRCRLLQVGLAGVALLSVGSAFWPEPTPEAADPPGQISDVVHETLDAREFVLRDAQGNAKGWLRTVDGNPVFTLQGQAGARITLEVQTMGGGDDYSRIAMSDENGNDRLALGSVHDDIGDSGLYMRNRQGESTTMLVQGRDSTYLGLYAPDHPNTYAQLVMPAYGKPEIRLFGADGFVFDSDGE